MVDKFFFFLGVFLTLLSVKVSAAGVAENSERDLSVMQSQISELDIEIKNIKLDFEESSAFGENLKKEICFIMTIKLYNNI